MSEWERISTETERDLQSILQTVGITDRLKITGGWLYRTRRDGDRLAMCFVQEET